MPLQKHDKNKFDGLINTSSEAVYASEITPTGLHVTLVIFYSKMSNLETFQFIGHLHERALTADESGC